MRSVADELRFRTAEQVLALPMRDRIALALSLGEDDLRLFAQASGLNPDVARARLRRGRARGRPASVALFPADWP
jgi:hypothetical protein